MRMLKTQHTLIVLELKIFQKEIKKFIGNKNIITNIYRIQAYDSIMCGYFRIGFIDFMLEGKSLLEHINVYSLSEYKRNIFNRL